MKAWLVTVLIVGSVALTSRSAFADFPTCPPGYAFTPATGLCYRYAYDQYYDPDYNDQGYFDQSYPSYPWYGYSPSWYGYSPYFYGGGFGRFNQGHDFVGGGNFFGRR